jgi:hypothetical protein
VPVLPVASVMPLMVVLFVTELLMLVSRCSQQLDVVRGTPSSYTVVCNEVYLYACALCQYFRYCSVFSFALDPLNVVVPVGWFV